MLADFLHSLFGTWRGARVRFVVLRNYESLPTAIGNDLDILVDDLAAAERILLGCAQSAGYRLCHHVAFGAHSYYFTDPALGRPIRIDLMTRLDWYGFVILAANEVFDSSRERPPFRIPHPAHEAALKLLLRLLYHGYVPEKYRPFIREAFAADEASAVRALTLPFGAHLARWLVHETLAQAWDGIERRRRWLLATLVVRSCLRRPRSTLALWLADTARRLRRALHPTGVTVALLGPDGSGKSTVASALLDRADLPLYRHHGRCVHWKPQIIPRGKNGTSPVPVTPHEQPPRGLLASSCYFLGHVAEFVIGAAARIRPALYANGLVVLDRYYYDFFVDAARYRLRLPLRVIDLGCRVIPSADMVFVLDAPPAILLARKQEVPAVEVERQREAFRRLGDRLPNAAVVDAAQPVEKVVDDIRRGVMEYLSVRAARQLRQARR
jgi:thymidylate kinase